MIVGNMIYKIFLTSKSLEGKTEQTLERYRYELSRLLQYLNKSTDRISSNDISRYMQCYKRIRRVSSSTLSGMRSCYSAFFAWCYNNNRIDRNPMVQVEKIKVPKTPNMANMEENENHIKIEQRTPYINNFFLSFNIVLR